MMVKWKLAILCFYVIYIDNVASTHLTFYMDDCSNDAVYYSITSSAVIYSHRGYEVTRKYDFSFRCILRFMAALPKWRIAVKILDYDLPADPYLDDNSCSDHLIFSNLTLNYYNNKIAVIDERNQFASGEASYVCNVMRKKHGNNTLEYFSEGDSQLYVGFETGSVAKGRGFKLLLTAFTTTYSSETCAVAVKDQTNSMLFPCGKGSNVYCISANLTCDKMPNCPGMKDWADEPPVRNCYSKVQTSTSLVDRLLSLGVAASLSITIGTVLVVIICLVASVCLCRKFLCREKKRPGPGSSLGNASYNIGAVSGGPYCINSRGGPGSGSYVNASQRSQFLGNTTVGSGGPYGHMYGNSSSKMTQDFRPMSPSHFSENPSIGGSVAGSYGGNYWGAQQQQSLASGVRVQYMAAPRHFESDSPHNTRPSQISSSGFGGSGAGGGGGGFPAPLPAGRSSSPSSKSARSNGAASMGYSGAQQPLTNGGDVLESQKSAAFMYYGRTSQQQVVAPAPQVNL